MPSIALMINKHPKYVIVSFRVLNWMMDNQRETDRVSGPGGHTDSERSSSHKRLRSTDVPHKQRYADCVKC